MEVDSHASLTTSLMLNLLAWILASINYSRTKLNRLTNFTVEGLSLSLSITDRHEWVCHGEAYHDRYITQCYHNITHCLIDLEKPYAKVHQSSINKSTHRGEGSHPSAVLFTGPLIGVNVTSSFSGPPADTSNPWFRIRSGLELRFMRGGVW